ncbi:MAG: hypothetical protein MMC33_000104 [Icmadophila ericetorum]|nr:hypothetical protein [Icmadophila ericetorum]
MAPTKPTVPAAKRYPHITFYQIKKSEPFERLTTRDGRRYKQTVLARSRRYLARPLKGELIKHEANGRFWFEKLSENIEEQIISEIEYKPAERLHHSDESRSESEGQTSSDSESREDTGSESPVSIEESDSGSDWERKPGDFC